MVPRLMARRKLLSMVPEGIRGKTGYAPIATPGTAASRTMQVLRHYEPVEYPYCRITFKVYLLSMTDGLW